MQKYDTLWNDINTLLSYLRGTTGNLVVTLVEQHYAPYNNSAPSQLLANQIEKLQKKLDEAE